jgi:hypothetical protein
MIGFDFNGVVDTGKYLPTIEDVIITSNHNFDSRRATLEWLRDHGVLCAVYFNPYSHDQVSGGNWKAEIITKLRIETFYEDDPIQFDIIKSSCPNITLIKV